MAEAPIDPLTVTVVGVVGGEVFGNGAGRAVENADVLVGARRHLERFTPPTRAQERVELTGPVEDIADQVARQHDGGRAVCVLASGDPGFFGIVRLLAAALPPGALAVLPAPSSIALAWGRAGLPWDDADVVSAHGRSLTDAIPAVLRSAKVAVLTDPTNRPEVVGRELIARGARDRSVVVASRLGEADEQVTRTDLAGLAGGAFDPLSVVLLVDPGHTSARPSISWGRPETEFGHRAGMITKAEVRAVVLSKLALPRSGVLWDVGAGSGSVGIEAGSIVPGLRVIAIEREVTDAARIGTNAGAAGVAIEVVVGDAPDALGPLPAPDRVFVGGGGLPAVEASWDRLGPGGVLVATFVVLESALAAHRLLGEMVQVQVNRCVPIGTSGVRLEPLNPVFVCWGER